MRLVLLQRQSVEQPAQLSSGHPKGCHTGLCWPLESTPLQAAVIKPEAIQIPVEDLQLVSLPVAEYKQGRRKGVELEHLLYERRQPVD